MTDDGYRPAAISIGRGEPVVLVLTRRSERTCATDIHLALPDGTRIGWQLPLGEVVEIPLRIDRPRHAHLRVRHGHGARHDRVR